MEISFKGPVMPIDPYSQLAFVEIPVHIHNVLCYEYDV